MNEQNCKKILLYGGSFLLAGAILLLAAVVLWRLLLPFLLGLLAAALLRPAVEFAVRRLKLPAGLSCILATALFYLSAALVCSFLIYRLTAECGNYLSDWLRDPAGLLDYLNESWEKIIGAHPKIASFLHADWAKDAAGKALSSLLAALSGVLTDWVGGVAAGMGHFFLFLTALLLSTYYFLRDRKGLAGAARVLLPTAVFRYIENFKKRLFGYLGSLLKATLILSGTTFGILLLGFFVLGVARSFSAALLLTLIDLLPILGAGTILIPWGIGCLLLGKSFRGILLLLLYGILLFLRQFLLPKLLGKGNGIPPLATIVALYAGYRIGGFIGLFLSPLVALPITAAVRAYLRRDEDRSRFSEASP